MKLQPYQQLYFTSYQYKSLLPVFPESAAVKKESIERLQKESYSFLLVAGIANPKNLIEYLKNYTSDLHTLIYPDHHRFNAKNRTEITNAFNGIKNEKKIIVTSEKDAVRLQADSFFTEKIKASLYYLPIEVVFQQEQEQLFIQKIENHVRNFKRNRILA
jgi:tetraacyldisaccharide 4'-kinase